MKNECNVARDLMPLVIDGVASEESQQYVDEHIAECADCKLIYGEMYAALPQVMAEKENVSLEKAAKTMHTKRMIRALWATIVSMTALLIAMLANAEQVAGFIDDAWFQLRYVGPNDELRLDAFNAVLTIEDPGLEILCVDSSPCGNRPFRVEFDVRYEELTGQAYVQMRLISSTEEKGLYHVGTEEVLGGGVYGFAMHDFTYVADQDSGRMSYHIWDDDYNHIDTVQINRIELVCGKDVQVLWQIGDSFPAEWRNGVLTKSEEPLPTPTPSPTPGNWVDYYRNNMKNATPTPEWEEEPSLPQRKQKQQQEKSS